MTEPVLDPQYWKRRLGEAKELHHSVYLCSSTLWRLIEENHRKILQQYIKPTDTILDAGCGYGRLLTLLPKEWAGRYVGVDISTDLLAIAEKEYQDRSNVSFRRADLRLLPIDLPVFDWAILISIKPMICRNVGIVAWEEIHEELKRHAKRIMYLEYNPHSQDSSVEEVI